jgi:Mg2+ and Co2+ transporter CorA
MDILNIQRDIKDLDAEIEELHNYVEIQIEKNTSQKLNTITWIGGILLPPSIITGFYGMNADLPLNQYSVYFTAISFFIIPIYLYLKPRQQNG